MPANATAMVRAAGIATPPASARAACAAGKAPGVTVFSAGQPGLAVLSVGSGTYRFTSS